MVVDFVVVVVVGGKTVVEDTLDITRLVVLGVVVRIALVSRCASKLK